MCQITSPVITIKRTQSKLKQYVGTHPHFQPFPARYGEKRQNNRRSRGVNMKHATAWTSPMKIKRNQCLRGETVFQPETLVAVGGGGAELKRKSEELDKQQTKKSYTKSKERWSLSCPPEMLAFCPVSSRSAVWGWPTCVTLSNPIHNIKRRKAKRKIKIARTEDKHETR